MSHRHAPFSFEGRLRLVQRCQQRLISHVAAEMGISRACASKWSTGGAVMVSSACTTGPQPHTTIRTRPLHGSLSGLGLGQRRFIDPSGHSNRKPSKIIARWPGTWHIWT